jgi:hypothetical protein
MKKGSESDSSSARLAATPLYFKQTVSSPPYTMRKKYVTVFEMKISNERKGVTY